MKKAFVLFLALTYLAMVSGLILNVHYCMGKLASVKIGHPEDVRCPDCGMENTGCCKDQVVVMKVDDSHSKPTLSIHFAKIIPAPLFRPAHDVVRHTLILNNVDSYDPSPPERFTGRSICIRHSQFRI